MILRAAVVPGAVALFAAGCSSIPVGSAPATRADEAPRVEDPGYEEALERATRTGAIYDGLEARAFGAATRQTAAFRRARVEAEGRYLHLPPGEIAARVEAERLESTHFHDFFLGFYTSARRWNDLDQRDSIWRVELEAGGATYLPLFVQRIERPDPNLVALYPYLTPFWVAYRIRFPARDSSGGTLFAAGEGVRLRLASAAGKLELVWEGEGSGTR